MKKLFTLIVVALFFSGNIQAQVPNPGFETLNADGSLRYWGNVYLFSGTMDSTGNFVLDSVLVNNWFYTSTSDAHSGSLALELNNGLNVTTGHPLAGAAGADEDTVFLGFGLSEMFSVQNQPTDLSFYLKFFPVGGDSGIARISVFDSSMFQIGEASIIIPDTVSSYTFYTTPVNYWTPGIVQYATLNFSAFYTEGSSYEPHYGTRMVVDDVRMDNVSGINSISQNDFSIYPNPSAEIINITSSHTAKNISVELTDITGKLIFKVEDKTQINISELPEGIYFLKITSDKNIATKKIIKNHQ